MKSLSNKVIVVTGGTRGLGAEITKALLAEDARVIALYKSDDSSAQKLSVWAIPRYKDYLEVIKHDITDKTLCDKLADHIRHTYGTLDGLVNNAGVMVRADITHITNEKMSYVLENNVMGVLTITQAFWSLLISKEGRAIVNISSAGARTGNPTELIYAASKGAVDAITRTLARDGATYGLSVNAIAPHVLDSGMGKETLAADPAILTRIPFKRSGEASELAALVLFLLSGSSSYLTGQVLHLNGGRLMMG